MEAGDVPHCNLQKHRAKLTAFEIKFALLPRLDLESNGQEVPGQHHGAGTRQKIKNDQAEKLRKRGDSHISHQEKNTLGWQ